MGLPVGRKPFSVNKTQLLPPLYLFCRQKLCPCNTIYYALVFSVRFLKNEPKKTNRRQKPVITRLKFTVQNENKNEPLKSGSFFSKKWTKTTCSFFLVHFLSNYQYTLFKAIITILSPLYIYNHIILSFHIKNYQMPSRILQNLLYLVPVLLACNPFLEEFALLQTTMMMKKT